VVENNFIVSSKILKFLKNSLKEQLKKYSSNEEMGDSPVLVDIEKI